MAIRGAFQEIEKELRRTNPVCGANTGGRGGNVGGSSSGGGGGAAAAGSDDTQWFLALLEPHLEKSREVAGHVLRYVEERGDLPPGELEPHDVADAALARAYDEFSKDHAPDDIRSRLVRFALDEIKAEVKRVKKDSERIVHLEQRVPETPPKEEVSTLGDEILDFYQPDEALKMENVIPDIEIPPPDQIAETKKLHRCVRAALNDLPKDARRALTLRYIVGLRGKELAKSLGKPEAEVERLIENTRAHLREKLAASGCIFTASDRTPARL